jgi:hypothetical protein
VARFDRVCPRTRNYALLTKGFTPEAATSSLSFQECIQKIYANVITPVPNLLISVTTVILYFFLFAFSRRASVLLAVSLTFRVVIANLYQTAILL